MNMRNNNAPLAIHITPHHLSLSPAIERYVETKLARVPRIASDALASDVVLRLHPGNAAGERFSASIRLALPGHDLHASASDGNLYTAIDATVDRLARLCRKRKTRRLRAADGRASRRKMAEVALPAGARIAAFA